jgi:riboflavin synthase alpha subunit
MILVPGTLDILRQLRKTSDVTALTIEADLVRYAVSEGSVIVAGTSLSGECNLFNGT